MLKTILSLTDKEKYIIFAYKFKKYQLMREEILRKIIDKSILSVTDMSSDEKMHLQSVMYRFGMSPSTCYIRFFYKGYDFWELDGVTKTISDFVVSVIKDIDDKDAADQLLKASKNPDSTFFKILTDLGMGVRLCDFMSERGMKSQTTVRKRFRTWNWKPWEMKGIKAILEEDFLKDTSDK